MSDLKRQVMNLRHACWGGLSLGCGAVTLGLMALGLFSKQFGNAMSDSLVTWGMTGGRSGSASAWWEIALASIVALWALGLVAAGIGLVRCERPRWPALVGLFVCLPPSALMLVSLAKVSLTHP